MSAATTVQAYQQARELVATMAQLDPTAFDTAEWIRLANWAGTVELLADYLGRLPT